jgi:predicted RecB family nuclease
MTEEPVDILARQFAECRELGIEVPDDMPLDTEDHRRMAVDYLGRLIFRERKRIGQEREKEE